MPRFSCANIMATHHSSPVSIGALRVTTLLRVLSSFFDCRNLWSLTLLVSSDRTVRLWATDRSTNVRIMLGHKGTVQVCVSNLVCVHGDSLKKKNLQSVKFHPNGNLLLSIAIDGLRCWSIKNGECVAHWPLESRPSSLTVSTWGRHVAVGGLECPKKVVEVEGSSHVFGLVQLLTEGSFTSIYIRDRCCEVFNILRWSKMPKRVRTSALR